jgi:cbb3-type cytochrome oxidase maturation protein
MNGLLTLVPIALALGLAALAAFLWALRSGQFDDLDGAAGRVLFDEADETQRLKSAPTGSAQGRHE